MHWKRQGRGKRVYITRLLKVAVDVNSALTELQTWITNERKFD